MTRAAVLALVSLAALFAGPAQAHKASDAYLTLQVDGARVEQRLDVALRDLDRDLVLDADDDGALRWGEVRARWPALTALAADAVRVGADGAACRTVASAAPALDDHVDGAYAVLRTTLQCAAPVRSLTLDYRLFAATDPTHRGIVRVVTAAGQQSAVAVPGAAALAFAVDGSGAAPGRGFAGFFVEGMHHIAIGLDHVLFLVTLLMVAVWRRDGHGWVARASARSAWAEAFKLVTAFTVAHSLTLALAALGVLAPPSRWVESLIAASVLLAAVDNLWPLLPGPRWPVVAFFGLVHGFGFAGPLQDLGLERGALALPLLVFNLGVEVGQLVIVALLLPLACALRHARWYRVGVVRVGSTAIALLALGWVLDRSLQLGML